MELFWIIFWAVVCYLYASDAKEKYPELDVNPINYIAGGALFGVFAWIWCWDKKRVVKQFKNLK